MSPADSIEDQLPGALEDLASLVAIQSVSADPARAAEVERSAEAVADLIRSLGWAYVEVVRAGTGSPSVIARFPAPEGMPTVCLYAHHDVQPEGDPALWKTDPWLATRVGDRLFGRGAADDKGGFAVHLAALRAFRGRPPVGVTLLIEGEEEIGSPTLAQLLADHQDDLNSDVFVIADSANWAVGQPAFTTTLRGLTDCIVEVRTLDHAVHSGSFGGAVPDALTALCRLLATLHDAEGNVAVDGLATANPPSLTYPEDRLRSDAGLLDGVRMIGSGSLVERIWCKPAISVVGLDATPVAQAVNALIPAARAKVSLRVAPGDDARQALKKLINHLHDHAPWGVQVSVGEGASGQPSVINFSGRYAEAARIATTQAWGVPPVFVGQGGSIPMIADFQTAFPAATVLVTAVADPDSRSHGPNESLHLSDFAAACRAEAALLEALSKINESASTRTAIHKT
jgi:acetylornithine deacetylase/succinyl-diaminopimelate desuccinylase-like protein